MRGPDFVALLMALPLLPAALAWGAAGHEIVATIAQIHLFPEVRAKLCGILPSEARCHLAPVAAWADVVKGRYRWTSTMHYVNAKEDHPADRCVFGEKGWVDEDINVLTAIMNMTQQVMDDQADIPLRFLTHFVGDMHQPLHLSGRDKGGNGAMFLFEGRHRNLHSVWDSGIITKNIRELSNYTSPLPSKQIESSLPGAIFDPYVRFIVWEGIRQWWPSAIPSWLSCPAEGDPYPHSSNSPIPPSHPRLNQLKALTAPLLFPLLSYLPGSISSLAAAALPPTLQPDAEGFPTLLLGNTPEKLSAQGLKHDFPACPYTWAKDMHDLNCEIVWPKAYTGEHGQPLIELDTDAYLGEIGRKKIVERMLAMAGLRLAKIVNEALGKDEGIKGVYLNY